MKCTVKTVVSEEKVSEDRYFDKKEEWVKKNNIKVGDTVRVKRKAERGEKGWILNWTDEMDEFIGREHKAVSISGREGIEFLNSNGICFSFPYFVLEKVIEPSYEEKQKEWVVKNNIKVGDTVRGTRKAEKGEKGWIFYWADVMDKYVGQKCKIIKIDDDSLSLSIPGDRCDYFPFFVLEKVEEPTYLEKQEEWIEENDIKVGDTVIVKRKAEDNENGWRTYWAGAMDKFIGQECEITGVDEFGIELSSCYYFPFFVLEKVIKPTYEEKQKEWVVKNNIKVGDTVIVKRKAENNENDWGGFWFRGMDGSIGQEMEIKRINDYGIELSRHGSCLCFTYPFFVLELGKVKVFKPISCNIICETIEEARLLFHVANTKILKYELNQNISSTYSKDFDTHFESNLWLELRKEISNQGFEI